MTRYYVDNAGKYLGGYDNVEPPAGAVEVQAPPEHGMDTWDAGQNKWVDFAEKYKIRRQAETAQIPLDNYLDALVKHWVSVGIQADPTKGLDTPEGLVAKTQAIKDKYPKPL